MDKKKFTSDELGKLIVAAVILVIGVLFCFSLSTGSQVLSIIIGSALMIAGLLYLLNSYMHTKVLLSSEGVIGTALFTFGLAYAVDSWMNIIIGFIPWVLIVFGVAVIADSCLKMFVSKTVDVIRFVVEAIIGVAMLVLGICLKTVPGFADFTALMLGIVLIAYSLFMIISVLFKSNKGEE